MKRLVQTQELPIDIAAAWDFFSSPKNLNEITPEEMVFEITSPLPEKMYEGMFITYNIKPMLNIPMQWCTEITHIKEQEFFEFDIEFTSENNIKQSKEFREILNLLPYLPTKALKELKSRLQEYKKLNEKGFF